MTLYVFQWPEWSDLWAFSASSDIDRLPRHNGENHWRLFRIIEDADALAARVPLQQVKEQIARYGYCLLQTRLQWAEQSSSF